MRTLIFRSRSRWLVALILVMAAPRTVVPEPKPGLAAGFLKRYNKAFGEKQQKVIRQAVKAVLADPNVLIEITELTRADAARFRNDLLSQLSQEGDRGIASLCAVLEHGFSADEPSAPFAAAAQAARELGSLSEGRERAIGCLAAALRAPQPRRRADFAARFGSLGNDSPAAGAALSALLLHDPDAAVRAQAASSLGRLGDVAVPYLAAALSSPNTAVGLAAIAGISETATDHENRPSLAYFLHGSRISLGGAIPPDLLEESSAAAEPGKISPAFARLLHGAALSENTEIRFRASLQLAHLGSIDDAILCALLQGFPNHPLSQRRVAASAMRYASTLTPPLERILISCLGEPDDDVRASALRAIAEDHVFGAETLDTSSGLRPALVGLLYPCQPVGIYARKMAGRAIYR